MTAHGASFSSSSKSKLWNYDVFLSFRGEDTRKGFTGHLHKALKDKGYKVFIDDNLKRGEKIKEELLRAIEDSRISIIVFSKKYANSSWCLDELVKIMKCKDKQGQHVLPIFYYVDPSHVRRQNKDLAEAFEIHERSACGEKDGEKREAKQERLKQWKEAFTKAGNLSGHHRTTDDKRSEAEFMEKIVDKITKNWPPSTDELYVAEYQVGINSRMQDIITYLSSDEGNKVRMVGIYGMRGSGKTTLAKAIHNQMHRKFEFKSFLADISVTKSKHGMVYVQETLVSDILKQTKSQKIRDVNKGITMIQQLLRRKRVLVIMDNIDDEEQLNEIVGSHKWFGPGSRIIITTSNRHLLKKVDKKYEVQKLENEEALELFSWHAFGDKQPTIGYRTHSKTVVSCCGGLPLALKVLGSFLFGRTQAEWKSESENLKRTPHGEIVKLLRVSFEGLDDAYKDIFLHISCFFLGRDKDYAAKVLDKCGFRATIGITVLCERCLLIVKDNKLYMHDLLHAMARVIISEKSPGHPEKWSRLWNCKEVTDVLRNKSGTEKVEGLALYDPSRHDKYSFSTVAFAKMKNLSFLHLYNVELKGEYKHLPKKLKWLRWRGFPLQSIPDDFFNQPKLAVLDMQQSKLVQVWEGSKSLGELKIINLSYSKNLKRSPDFSKVPKLEELILESCEKLSEIHRSIGHLKRLSLVNLQGCPELTSLPTDFYKSESVKTLLLNGCRGFREVHENLGKMKSLRIIEADFTAIRQIPTSIEGLKNLTRLSLKHVKAIRFPSPLRHLNSLKELDLSGCRLLDDEIPDLGSLNSLRYLYLRENDFKSLPSLPDDLEILAIHGCKNFRPGTHLRSTVRVETE